MLSLSLSGSNNFLCLIVVFEHLVICLTSLNSKKELHVAMWPLNCSKNRKQSFYFTSAICLYHRTLTLKTQLEGKSDNGSVCELPSSVSYFHRLVVTNGAGACCRAVLIYKAINTTLATKKKRYAMSLSLSDECYYLGICLGGLFFGTISVLQLP